MSALTALANVLRHSAQATPAAATSRLDFEDSGACNCGCFEAGSACSELLTDPVPMEPPGPSLTAVLALTAGIAFVCIVALHLALRAWPQ